jgi:hypothetical protein
MIEYEFFPHNHQQIFNGFQNDLLPQGSGVDANKQVFEVSTAVIFSNCYESKYVSNLAINHKDHISFSLISLEIFQDTKNNMQQPSVLQKDEIGSIYEVENMQRQSHIQLE